MDHATAEHSDSGDGSRIDPVLARSWLLVNGAQYDRFAPAAASRADIVVLDIEDAVAPKDKLSARENVIRWLSEGNSDWVRVNGFGTPWWADDLDALGKLSPGGVMLAMVESVDHVTETAKRLPNVPIVALVETARWARAHHRDRGHQGHIPAGVRHRRLPKGYRIRGQPDDAGVCAFTVHDRGQGCASPERDRRADGGFECAQAQ